MAWIGRCKINWAHTIPAFYIHGWRLSPSKSFYLVGIYFLNSINLCKKYFHPNLSILRLYILFIPCTLRRALHTLQRKITLRMSPYKTLTDNCAGSELQQWTWRWQPLAEGHFTLIMGAKSMDTSFLQIICKVIQTNADRPLTFSAGSTVSLKSCIKWGGTFVSSTSLPAELKVPLSCCGTYLQGNTKI